MNTLKYAKVLETAGVSRKQAEAHVEIISSVLENDMATKQDLKELEYRLTIKISGIVFGIMTTLLGLTIAALKLL